MTDRFDALSVRESNGKSYFTKVGVAFPNRSGDGYTVFLDAVPAPTEGQFKILLKTPQPRDGQQRGGGSQSQGGGRDLDDSIPF